MTAFAAALQYLSARQRAVLILRDVLEWPAAEVAGLLGREALLAPLDPGSTVIIMSSGAALRGSPLSGGYAGAKATIRFIAAYAAGESARDRLGIRFVSVLPQLTPATALGAAAVAAYAAREGMDVAAYLDRSGPVLTASQVADAIAQLLSGPRFDQEAYLLTAAGLRPGGLPAHGGGPQPAQLTLPGRGRAPGHAVAASP